MRNILETIFQKIVIKANKPIDHSGLILFRIFFGFLFACEAFGAIITGWVRTNLVEVNFTFNFIHMDFLQVLVGPNMYAYFILMGLCSIGVMLGWRYRLSICLLTVLWAGAYFMQKTSYNNHYYLLLILCLYMCFVPANNEISMDVRAKRVKEVYYMPAYLSYLFIFQLFIVYFYGTIAKFYPDWLDGTFTQLMYVNAPIGDYFQQLFSVKWFAVFIAYMGILFDGIIIILFLFKSTRTIALIASLIFHLFNSITLQIGVFPYLALSFVVFFYQGELLRKIFFRKTYLSLNVAENLASKGFGRVNTWIIGLLVVLQLFLPIRMCFINSDVLWSDEGHRLSWRMMLRARSGVTEFRVVDVGQSDGFIYNLQDVLTVKQMQRLISADMIWQMAQYIKNEYMKQGRNVQVYADSFVSINGRSMKRYIDPKVDLAAVPWNYFSACPWILDKPF